jgi:aspartyl protease family protein
LAWPHDLSKTGKASYICRMTGDQTASFLYLSLLGAALAMWFFAQNRQNLGKTAQQAIVWGLIIFGTVAAVGLWGDVRTQINPGIATISSDNQITLDRAMDGHYYLTAQVNGTPVDFVVDTGATGIVLTNADAEAAGIDTDSLAYVGRAMTANGEVLTAPVTLESITVGPLRDTRVRATVNAGEMDRSLLGMEYLQRFSSVEITGGKMVLTR